KHPRVTARLRKANARPQLPRPIRRLPHTKIDGLLPLARILAQVGIPRHAPPFHVDLGHQNLLRAPSRYPQHHGNPTEQYRRTHTDLPSKPHKDEKPSTRRLSSNKKSAQRATEKFPLPTGEFIVRF